MRARGLSSKGGRACDDGRSPRVGSEPHAASSTDASSTTRALNPVRISATGARRASSNGLGLAPRRILWTMVSVGAIAVFVRRVSNSWSTRQCPMKEGSCQLTRTEFHSVGRGPNASRVPIAHLTVSSMSCDTRRIKSDILRFASPSTLVPGFLLARGSKDGSSSLPLADSALLSCRFGNCAFGRPACVRRVQLRSEHHNRRHQDPPLQSSRTASGAR